MILKTLQQEVRYNLFLGPTFYIDYEFGEDIYAMSSFQMEVNEISFSFEIEETVRLINHYYETKMSIMKLSVESDLS